MKTPSINSLRHKSATKTMIYRGHLVWNIGKIKIRFTGKQKMTEAPTKYELRTRFNCLDCYKDTMPEPNDYQIQDDLWLSICPGWVGHLCLRCLRVRLQRDLKLSDFKTGWEINDHITQELLNEVNS